VTFYQDKQLIILNSQVLSFEQIWTYQKTSVKGNLQAIFVFLAFWHNFCKLGAGVGKIGILGFNQMWDCRWLEDLEGLPIAGITDLPQIAQTALREFGDLFSMSRRCVNSGGNWQVWELASAKVFQGLTGRLQQTRTNLAWNIGWQRRKGKGPADRMTIWKASKKITS